MKNRLLLLTILFGIIVFSNAEGVEVFSRSFVVGDQKQEDIITFPRNCAFNMELEDHADPLVQNLSLVKSLDFQALSNHRVLNFSSLRKEEFAMFALTSDNLAVFTILIITGSWKESQLSISKAVLLKNQKESLLLL